MTTHGDLCNHRYETTLMGIPSAATTPSMVITIPTSTLTVIVCERYCVVHGWHEVRGVMGALVWNLEHGECSP